MEEIRNNYIYAVKAKVGGFFKTSGIFAYLPASVSKQIMLL